jgi:hypothetical protein
MVSRASSEEELTFLVSMRCIVLASTVRTGVSKLEGMTDG